MNHDVGVKLGRRVVALRQAGADPALGLDEQTMQMLWSAVSEGTSGAHTALWALVEALEHAFQDAEIAATAIQVDEHTGRLQLAANVREEIARKVLECLVSRRGESAVQKVMTPEFEVLRWMGPARMPDDSGLRILRRIAHSMSSWSPVSPWNRVRTMVSWEAFLALTKDSRSRTAVADGSQASVDADLATRKAQLWRHFADQGLNLPFPISYTESKSIRAAGMNGRYARTIHGSALRALELAALPQSPAWYNPGYPLMLLEIAALSLVSWGELRRVLLPDQEIDDFAYQSVARHAVDATLPQESDQKHPAGIHYPPVEALLRSDQYPELVKLVGRACEEDSLPEVMWKGAPPKWALAVVHMTMAVAAWKSQTPVGGQKVSRGAVDLSPLLSLHNAARMSGVSETRIRRWMGQGLVKDLRGQRGETPGRRERIRLTVQQFEDIKLLGKSHADLAKDAGISVRNVRRRLQLLKTKAGVSNELDRRRQLLGLRQGQQPNENTEAAGLLPDIDRGGDDDGME